MRIWTFTHGMWTHTTFDNRRPSPGPRSFEEGDVCRDALLILRKALAELRSQQVVLNAHADFRADEKEQKRGQQEPPGCDQKTCAEQDAQHGCIDGMADETVRS